MESFTRLGTDPAPGYEGEPVPGPEHDPGDPPPSGSPRCGAPHHPCPFNTASSAARV